MIHPLAQAAIESSGGFVKKLRLKPRVVTPKPEPKPEAPKITFKKRRTILAPVITSNTRIDLT